MNPAEFQGMMQALGLRASGAQALGAWQGWPILIKHRQAYGSSSLEASLPLSRRPDAPLRKDLCQQIKQLKGCSAVLGVQALVTVLERKKDGDLKERLSQALDLLVRGLREGGVTPPEACPLCKSGGCDSMGLVGEGYVPLHRSCVENQARSALQKAEHNAAAGSYLTGLIGALLGGLVGTIPSILAALLAERVFALLYALIPICAYYGYKLLRGKMNKGAFVCTLLSSLVNLFVMQFLYVYVIFIQRLGQMLSPGDALYFYIDMLQTGSLTADLAQSALFLALGLWISWSVITKTSRHEIHSFAAMADTLQPLQNTDAAAPARSE